MRTLSLPFREVRGALALLTVLLLGACSHLPVSGPDYRDIDRNSKVTLANHDGVVLDYALVDISPRVLQTLEDTPAGSFHKSFGLSKGPPPVVRVGTGDVLQVSVFESAAGGLFVPAEAGVRPGNFVTLPNQSVSRAGTVSVPYAGPVRASGRTIPEIERDIQAKLASRAIEPQAVVTLVEQNASSVTVTGDTGNSKIKITGAGERVLDMISRAGGSRFPGYELMVTLQRGHRKATLYFPFLISRPEENIYVYPGDTIYVQRQPQKFVALGALGAGGQTSGLTGQFTFDQEKLSLNEAIARAGGLLDARANPAQVFLYRLERREALAAMGVPLSKLPTNMELVPTIYRANFRDPSSFFYAQAFPMRDKDLIYVANSDSTEVTKFATYLRTISSTVSGVGVDIATTRDLVGGAKILTTSGN